MKKLIASLLIAAIFFNSSAQTCFPLDSSFGVAGKAVAFNSASWFNSTNLVIQPDNKILQFSAGSNEFIAVRYKVNGSLDSSFGVNGKVSIIAAPLVFMSYGALQSDGKIVMAGYGRPTGTSYYKIIVARLNSNGALDNSFGTSGMIYISVGTSNNEAHGVAIQPDGKILVVGVSPGSCFYDCLNLLFCKPLVTVFRFNSNGTPDLGFGQGGYITAGVGSFESGTGNTVLLQSDGKIVVTGDAYHYYCDDYYGGSAWSSGFFMKRFHSNGVPDSSFGLNGQVLDTTVQINASSFAILPDGKFLTSGNTFAGGYIVRRFLANGTIDNTFAQTANLEVAVKSLVAMPNGKIVFGGTSWTNGQNNFYVARLNSDGTPDSSFNINGKLLIRVVPATIYSDNQLTGLALQGSQIIAGGTSTTYSGSTVQQQIALRISDSVKGLAVFVTPPGPIYPCTGTSLTLSTSLPGNYQWYISGQPISGAVNSNYTALVSGYYSVRVSNASGCGLSGEVITAFDGLPVHVIADGDLDICQGDSVKLKSSETTGSLQWYFTYQQNNQVINGATDSVYWAKQTGGYFVRVNNSKGCGNSTTAYLNVYPAKPPINWNGTLLSTTTGYTGYQWYLNGNAIPGATTPFYQPNSTGVYKVVIPGFICGTTSEDFNLNCVQVNVPKPVVSWNGFQLYTTNGFASYQWYYNNTAVTGAVGSSVTALQTGIYRVDITGKFNCPNSSNDFDLNCNIVGPGKPIINWNGVQFSVGGGYSYYQWYYNDSAIIGATASSYTPQPNKFGSYKVEVGNDYNCRIFSDSRLYSPTATVIIGQARISYYPNPASNIFYVDVSQPTLKQMNLVLYDLNGKVLLRKPLKIGQNQIPVDKLSSGLYQLEINNGTDRQSVKLSIVR